MGFTFGASANSASYTLTVAWHCGRCDHTCHRYAKSLCSCAFDGCVRGGRGPNNTCFLYRSDGSNIQVPAGLERHLSRQARETRKKYRMRILAHLGSTPFGDRDQPFWTLCFRVGDKGRLRIVNKMPNRYGDVDSYCRPTSSTMYYKLVLCQGNSLNDHDSHPMTNTTILHYLPNAQLTSGWGFIGLPSIWVSWSAVFVLGVWSLFSRNDQDTHPPGPAGLPLIGNVHQMTHDAWNKFTEWKAIYGELKSPYDATSAG